MIPPSIAASTQAQIIAHALGWTLLHFLWQGTLIALVLACIFALLGERSPQPRYLAACTALLLMIAAPIATFARILSASRLSAHTIITVISLDPVTVNATGSPSEPLLQRLAETLDRRMPAFLLLWFAGVLLLLARLTLGLIIARRMKSVATQPPPGDLLAAFQQLTRRIGVSRPVRLLHSALVQVPTVIGWLRPVVLIPLGCLANLSPTQLEAILAHELAHIRRHDYLISVLQSIVEAVLFYHPAVWWVSQRIRLEREHCCDDLAVRIGGDPLTYARALSLLAEQSLALPAIALGANGGILTMRIKRLLTPKEGPATSQLAAITILGIVIAATGLFLGTARAQAKPAPEPTPVAAPAPAATPAPAPIAAAPLLSRNVVPAVVTPVLSQPPSIGAQPPAQQISPIFLNWLNQDVRWIITPQERAAFLQLTTDADRDSYIEDFWRQRDPAGSAESARARHYQRIAYANQHFAQGKTPGWLTDRGRMYILNGQPDMVDRSSIAPAVAAQPAPKPAAAPKQTPRIQPVSYTPALPPQPPPSNEPAAPARVRSDIMSRQVTSNVNPVYPPIAKAAHIQGTVVLHAIISTKGDVKELQVISGPEALRASAMDAVRLWTYKPYLLNGQPTEVETNINVTYSYGDSTPDSTTQPTEERAYGLVAKRIGNGVSAPQVISQVEPEFSEEAKKDKTFTSGKVLVHLFVDEQGNPMHVYVIRGVGHGLDEQAILAVQKYKFSPAMQNGQPVLVALNIEVDFERF